MKNVVNELQVANGRGKIERSEMHDLIVFDKVAKKVLSEISISAPNVTKAVKKVKQNFEDPSVLVLQKSAFPSLGIFKFESSARLHASVSV